MASTPKPENAPAPTSEDTMFLGWQLLSEEELINVLGSMEAVGAQGSEPIGLTDQIYCGLPNIDYNTAVEISTQLSITLKKIRIGITPIIEITIELNSDGTFTISVSSIGLEYSVNIKIKNIPKYNY